MILCDGFAARVSSDRFLRYFDHRIDICNRFFHKSVNGIPCFWSCKQRTRIFRRRKMSGTVSLWFLSNVRWTSWFWFGAQSLRWFAEFRLIDHLAILNRNVLLVHVWCYRQFPVSSFPSFWEFFSSRWLFPCVWLDQFIVIDEQVTIKASKLQEAYKPSYKHTVSIWFKVINKNNFYKPLKCVCSFRSSRKKEWKNEKMNKCKVSKQMQWKLDRVRKLISWTDKTRVCVWDLTPMFKQCPMKLAQFYKINILWRS